MRSQQGAHEWRRVTIRKEQPDRIAGVKIKPLRMHLDFALAKKSEMSQHPFETATGGIGFDGKMDFAVILLDSEIEQKHDQPIPRQPIIIQRQNALDARRVILARRKVRTQEQEIARSQ